MHASQPGYKLKLLSSFFPDAVYPQVEKVFHSSHLLSSCFPGQSFRLLLRRAGSHSITYLCDNITVEKPSKQPCSQTKPAASTAKCSSGVIVLQLLVATIVHVHISFFSHSNVTCYTFFFYQFYDFEVTTGPPFSAPLKCHLGGCFTIVSISLFLGELQRYQQCTAILNTVLFVSQQFALHSC